MDFTSLIDAPLLLIDDLGTEPMMRNITVEYLFTLLNERAHLSPEMALRIEKAFGVAMDTLMRMQNSYDIAQARKRAGDIKVERYSGLNTKGRA